MASEPSTPVRVPKAAATYAPTTQDPELRSSINSLLLQGGHINKIQEALLHALHASPTNWPTLIQNHALNILRSGDCNTFPELMSRVMEDIREETLTAQAASQKSQTQPQQGQSNGVGGKPGNVKEKEHGDRIKGSGEGGINLALPKNVVDEGVRITRECLEQVCEVD